MNYNRAQLKEHAKGAISAARPSPVLILLLYLVICFVITNFMPRLVPNAFVFFTDPLMDAVGEAFEESMDIFEEEGGSLDDFTYIFEYMLEDELYDLEDDDDFAQFIDALDEMDYALNRADSPLEFFELWDEAMDENDDLEDFVKPLLRRIRLLAFLSSVVSLAATLITLTLQYGYCGYCLEVFRTGNSRVGKLFSAFPRVLQVVGSSIMVGIFTFLWSLLFIAVFAVLGVIGAMIPALNGYIGMLVMLVIMIVALVFYIAVIMRYALVPYVVVEERNLGVFDCIRRSKELMKRRKFKLFFLEFSFIGWYILVGLIPTVLIGVGIGLFALLAEELLGLAIVLGIIFLLLALIVPLPLQLWLTSYVNISTAGFYHFAAASASPEVSAYAGTPVESAPVVPVQPTPAAPVQPAPVVPVQPTPVVPVQPIPVVPVQPIPEVPVQPDAEIPAETVVIAPVEPTVEESGETVVIAPAEPAPETPVFPE